MTEQTPEQTTPQPKSSETDPPAADRPVDDSPGNPPPKAPDPVNEKGRAANDPSMPVSPNPATGQVSQGKPDGEVDTGNGASSLADGRGR